jgi:2-keto-3-deoxy-L-rhamnonate aldolase RhmA
MKREETTVSDQMSLKARIAAGEKIQIVRIPISSTREQVHDILNEKPCDMLYIDSQHGPYTEWDVHRISNAAEEKGVPVQLRIKHTRHTYMLGSYLDLGPMSIKVPEVEEEWVVDEAINSFYFPPIGRRSWGGRVGYGISDPPEGDEQYAKWRRAYAEWWNQNGILQIKIESIKAVLNVRSLAKPGVDCLDFGGEDLRFDLENHPHPHLKTAEDCKKFVRKELEGSPVLVR